MINVYSARAPLEQHWRSRWPATDRSPFGRAMQDRRRRRWRKTRENEAARLPGATVLPAPGERSYRGHAEDDNAGDIGLVSVPTQKLRGFLERAPSEHLSDAHIWSPAAKVHRTRDGVWDRLQIIAEIVPTMPYQPCLTGPSFAHDIAKRSADRSDAGLRRPGCGGKIGCSKP